MSAIENKQILQHVFAETAKGNGRPFVDALAEDVAWTIIGATPWSKTYHGKAVVLRDCWVFRFSERKVVELVESTDTALIESALRPPSA